MGFPSSVCGLFVSASASYYAPLRPCQFPLPLFHASPACPPLLHRSSLPVLHAKRRSQQPISVQEELPDEDFRASLNEVSTEAVKVMLSDDSRRMEDFMEKLDYLEDFLSKEGDSDAALFMLVIRGMLDHKILPQANDLKGFYKKAFDKICSILEDSGWLLKGDGAEFGVAMVDDELIPPTLQSQYYQ